MGLEGFKDYVLDREFVIFDKKFLFYYCDMRFIWYCKVNDEMRGYVFWFSNIVYIFSL